MPNQTFFTFALSTSKAQGMNILHPNHDHDFELWKNYPEKFFRINRDTIQDVITNNCFCGHRNLKMLREWNDLIVQVMQSESVVNKLNAYAHQGSFLIFYAALLKEEVVLQSKNEDIVMLQSDYNNLVLKYNSLVEMLTRKLLRYYPQFNLPEADLIQQVTTNLLGKKQYISSLYNNHLPFCSYIWSVIHNEIFNLIRKEVRHQKLMRPIANEGTEQFTVEQFSEKDLMIEDSLNIFHNRTLTYLAKRPRLILCLKTKFKIKISNKNLDDLFNTTICSKASNVATSFIGHMNHEQNITKRYEMLKHILNAAENTSTDEESYRRWTDQQIERLIDYLNNFYIMSFDHKSFAILVDRYFNKFHDQ
jgi:hypothetical protein